MNEVFFEIFIVFILTLLNGFFACSEIALISIRPTQVKELVGRGSKRARIVQLLRADPEQLFATIQVGISVVTIFASAYAGSSLAGDLAVYLRNIENSFISQNAYTISFIIIVAAITYLNLILGELVPKSLGFRYAQNFALYASYPIWWLSKITKWLVRLLTASSNLILSPFKDSTNFIESRISEEEIRTILAEGREAGTIESREHEIIENVFEFSDLPVGKIMIPRTQISAFDVNSPALEVIRGAVESGYSRIPIYQDTINNIVGILYTKKLLKLVGGSPENIKIDEYLIPPYFVPNSMKIDEVLRKLQRKNLHMALVTDEHGEIEGLVTLEDILEELVGDIADETDEANKNIMAHEEGHFLVTGQVSIVDFNKYFESDIPEDQGYSTVSGFILHNLERFPNEGDKVNHKNLELMVKEKTLRTVKLVEVRKIQ